MLSRNADRRPSEMPGVWKGGSPAEEQPRPSASSSVHPGRDSEGPRTRRRVPGAVRREIVPYSVWVELCRRHVHEHILIFFRSTGFFRLIFVNFFPFPFFFGGGG